MKGNAERRDPGGKVEGERETREERDFSSVAYGIARTSRALLSPFVRIYFFCLCRGFYWRSKTEVTYTRIHVGDEIYTGCPT